MVKRPSDDLKICAACHKKAAANYGKALHYTSLGQRHGVLPRFSKEEVKTFDSKVLSSPAGAAMPPADPVT